MEKQHAAVQHGVKQKIMDALLSLLETERFSEISVTDIVRRAGVARQSYYRNFSSREEIIEAFFDELHAETLHAVVARQVPYPSEQSAVLVLAAIKKRRRELMTLYRSGFSQYMLKAINEITEVLLGDMPTRSIERYQLSMFSGAVYNTAVAWLAQGAVESCEDMAKVICAFKTADLLARQVSASKEE